MTTQQKAPITARFIDKDSLELIVRSAKEETITINPQGAAHIGRAILAASVVCGAPPPHPAKGTEIENCHFPVEKWSVGYSNVNGEPIVGLTVSGGMQLIFQLPHEIARELGEALAKVGQKQATQEGRPN
jgi:hypothetical protein